jgi:hypothetical protein
VRCFSATQAHCAWPHAVHDEQVWVARVRGLPLPRIVEEAVQDVLSSQAYRSNPDRGFVSTNSPRRFIQSLEQERQRSQTAFWTMALPIPTTTSPAPQFGQSGGSGKLCSAQSRSNLPHSAQSKNTPAL